MTAPGAVTPPGSAGPRPLAELDNISRASRQGPRRLTGSKSRQPLVCLAVVTGRQSRVVSTPIQAIRRAVCRQRRRTHGDPMAFSRGVSPPPPRFILPGISESGRAGQSSLRVDRLVTRSESTVPHGSRRITARSMPTPPTGRSAVRAPHFPFLPFIMSFITIRNLGILSTIYFIYCIYHADNL